MGRGAGWLARVRDVVRHRDHHVASRAEAAPRLRPAGRLLVRVRVRVRVRVALVLRPPHASAQRGGSW